jgi:hypothetical protein
MYSAETRAGESHYQLRSLQKAETHQKNLDRPWDIYGPNELKEAEVDLLQELHCVRDSLPLKPELQRLMNTHRTNGMTWDIP